MSVAMGSRRRPRHRSRFRAMPRPPLDERPDEQPGGVPAGTQAPLIRIAPKEFAEADSWESWKSGRDVSLVSFLKEIFPMASFSDIMLLEIAFQLVEKARDDSAELGTPSAS